MECTEDRFIQVIEVEQSSCIMLWTVLKTDLYRLLREQTSSTVMKIVFYRVVGGSFFSYTALGFTEDCIIQFLWEGAVFWHTAFDCTVDCYIQVGERGAFFRYTAMDCTQVCFIQVGDWGAFFWYTAVDYTEDSFIRVGGGSILQVYGGGLY